MDIFKVDQKEVSCMDQLMSRAYNLIAVQQPVGQGQKRTYQEAKKSQDQSLALQRIIKREEIWSKSKNAINKKSDIENRTSKYDLTNYDIEISGEIKSKFTKKREQKDYLKRDCLVKPVL